MIANSMREYNFYTLGEDDAYGQPQIDSPIPRGKVKMSVNLASQNTTDNILYADCEYVGLTHANVEDTYIIEYGIERLKVKYINPAGRYKQVYMVRI